jgi:lysyl-tRNA synthetase class 1
LHEAIKSRNYDPKYGFALFYRVLIGKEKGPRLGYFLSHLDKNMIVARIKFAISQ